MDLDGDGFDELLLVVSKSNRLSCCAWCRQIAGTRCRAGRTFTL